MVDMGTTTKLTAPSIFADGDHAHDVAILLAEQVHGTQGDGVVELHLLRGDGKIFAQLLVDTRLDGVHRILARGAGPLEVETQTVRRVFRAALGGLRAKLLTQRLVHHVGRGMRAGDGTASVKVDVGVDFGADNNVPSVRRHWCTMRSLIGFCTSSTSSTAPSSERISP